MQLRRLCTVQNDPYAFPYVMVCLFDGSGCGYLDGETDECVASVSATVYAGDDDYEDAVVPGSVSDFRLAAQPSTRASMFFLCILFFLRSRTDLLGGEHLTM